MRKVIFAAVVVVLAGTCWVVAQNASSIKPPSPYRSVPSPKAQTPTEKAEAMANSVPGEMLVAPTTELDVPGIPALPGVSTLPPPISSFAKPGLPEPSVTTPLDLPPPVSTLPPPSTPIYPPPLPIPSDTKPLVQAVTTPAIPGLPPLPSIPGVPSRPPGVPTYVGPVAQGNGQPIIIPEKLNPTGPNWTANPPVVPPPKNPGSPWWTVDDPRYWNGRERSFDEYRAQELGPQVWGSAEYLFWFIKPSKAPPLVQAVTATAPTFAPERAVTLFPAGSIDFNPLDGARGTVGVWFNRIQTLGMEASYFWFGRVEFDDVFASGPNAFLGRPFFNAATGRNALFEVSSPATGTTGLIAVRNAIRVEGGDANVMYNSPTIGTGLNFLAGFRYLEVAEDLRIDHFARNPAAGMEGFSYDAFQTRNQFFGGQLGVRWNYLSERVFVSVTGKIAVGAMQERVHIEGGTAVSMDGLGTVRSAGGVLALPTNIGTYSRSRTAFIPEGTATFGFRVSPRATVFAGYNFMYVSEALRPGRQIDTAVNPENFPFGTGAAGARRPAFQFRSEDLWLQGVNVGLMFQY